MEKPVFIDWYLIIEPFEGCQYLSIVLIIFAFDLKCKEILDVWQYVCEIENFVEEIFSIIFEHPYFEVSLIEDLRVLGEEGNAMILTGFDIGLVLIFTIKFMENENFFVLKRFTLGYGLLLLHFLNLGYQVLDVPQLFSF